MALSIRDPETDRLARELAALTGESMKEAIRIALQQRLARERARRDGHARRKRRELLKLLQEFRKRPVLEEHAW